MGRGPAGSSGEAARSRGGEFDEGGAGDQPMEPEGVELLCDKKTLNAL